MGRSFERVRMSAKDVSARWLKASRALKKVDKVYGQRLSVGKLHPFKFFKYFSSNKFLASALKYSHRIRL